MRLATWNVNSLTVRLPQVIDWHGYKPTRWMPCVLQEAQSSQTTSFPAEALEPQQATKPLPLGKRPTTALP